MPPHVYTGPLTPLQELQRLLDGSSPSAAAQQQQLQAVQAAAAASVTRPQVPTLAAQLR